MGRGEETRGREGREQSRQVAAVSVGVVDVVFFVGVRTSDGKIRRLLRWFCCRARVQRSGPVRLLHATPASARHPAPTGLFFSLCSLRPSCQRPGRHPLPVRGARRKRPAQAAVEIASGTRRRFSAEPSALASLPPLAVALTPFARLCRPQARRPDGQRPYPGRSQRLHGHEHALCQRQSPPPPARSRPRAARTSVPRPIACACLPPPHPWIASSTRRRSPTVLSLCGRRSRRRRRRRGAAQLLLDWFSCCCCFYCCLCCCCCAVRPWPRPPSRSRSRSHWLPTAPLLPLALDIFARRPHPSPHRPMLVLSLAYSKLCPHTSSPFA